MKVKKDPVLKMYNYYVSYKESYPVLCLADFCNKNSIRQCQLQYFITRKDMFSNNENKYKKFTQAINKMDEFYGKGFKSNKKEGCKYKRFILENPHFDILPKRLEFFAGHVHLNEKLIELGIPYEKVYSQHGFLLDEYNNNKGKKMEFKAVSVGSSKIVIENWQAVVPTRIKPKDVEMTLNGVNGVKIIIPGDLEQEKVVKIFNFLRDL